MSHWVVLDKLLCGTFFGDAAGEGMSGNNLCVGCSRGQIFFTNPWVRSRKVPVFVPAAWLQSGDHQRTGNGEVNVWVRPLAGGRFI